MARLGASNFGCGSHDSTGTSADSPSDTRQIAGVYERWTAAAADGRFEAACSLQTEALQIELASVAREIAPGNATCAAGLEVSVPATRPDLGIESIEVSGKNAVARVGLATWRFLKVGGDWRIAHLDSAGTSPSITSTVV